MQNYEFSCCPMRTHKLLKPGQFCRADDRLRNEVSASTPSSRRKYTRPDALPATIVTLSVQERNPDKTRLHRFLLCHNYHHWLSLPTWSRVAASSLTPTTEITVARSGSVRLKSLLDRLVTSR